MAVQPQQMPEFSPVVQATEHESDLDAVTRSLLNPEPEGEQPDPEDSPDEEPTVDDGDLDPADAEEDEDPEEAEGEDEDEPQESDDSEEEPEEDEDDDEDFEDEDEPDEAAELIEVKVDGKVHQVTLDELKRDYSGNKRIEADIQAAREATKALETAQAEAAQRAQVAEQALQVAYAVAMEDVADPDIDWDALHEIDPQEWSHQRELYRAKQEKAQQKVAHIQQAVQAQQAEAEKADAAMKQQIAQREAKILREAYPVFSDDTKGMERYNELAKFALERYGKYGLTPEMLGEVQLAVPLIMLNEVYDMVNGEKPKPTKKTKRRRKKTVRPGNGTRETPTTRSRKSRERLENRAYDTGHPDDVAKTMFVEPTK